MPIQYGQNPFKCPILSWSYRCRGFPTRSERNTHTQRHARRWNCDFEGCEYAETGFFSRRMRNAHLEMSHKRTYPDTSSFSAPLVPDEDEIEPLLLDLVRADKLAQVQTLLPSLQEPSPLILWELQNMAARNASRAMMEVLFPEGTKIEPLDF